MVFDRFYNTATATGFHWPGRILAGAATLAGWLEGTDSANLVIVADQAFARHDGVLAKGGAAIIVRREPHAADIEAACADFGMTAPVTILAIGGGATLDTAKALTARLRFGSCEIRDRPRAASPVRLVAAPTTAGSGSETSRFFIASDDATGAKRAVRSWDVVPDLTILDPELLASASPRQLLLGAFDAVIHLWETHIARGERSVFTDALAQGFIPRILAQLPAIVGGETLTTAARLDLMQASAMAGMAISNVRTGMMHTLGESLSAEIELPHPMTLKVFLRPAIESYAHAVADHTVPLWAMADAVAPWRRPWSTHRFIDAWEDAFSRLRLDDEMAMAFATTPVSLDALCANAARDTTLPKENPLPVDAAALRLIAAAGLARWPRAPGAVSRAVNRR